MFRVIIQHWNSDDARCFYWSVMCEAMLEYRGSYEQAMVCVKKAAGYNPSYPDWRIFICRILLENSADVVRNPEPVDGGDAAGHGPEHDPAEVLSETLQVPSLPFIVGARPGVHSADSLRCVLYFTAVTGTNRE